MNFMTIMKDGDTVNLAMRFKVLVVCIGMMFAGLWIGMNSATGTS